MWKFVLGNLNGEAIGEITNATTRTLSIGLNRVSTASCIIRADNPLAISLFSGDRLLKVYENNTLRFHGLVVSSELTGSGTETPTIQINAADPGWRLSKRLLGLSKGGTAYGPYDKAKIARLFIAELNSSLTLFNPHTGIKLLPESSYVGGSGSYIAGPYRPALTCINDLAHTITGFDWYIAPLEGKETTTFSNAGGTWTTPLIGQFEATNAFGTSKGTVFEYGYGQKNVRTISYIRDLNDLVNRAYHLPNDMETESVLSFYDGGSEVYRGPSEATADAFGLTNTALRESWLQEVIRVKKNPRYVVTMTLDIDDGTGRVPQLGTDYWLGDLVTARSYLANNKLFSGQVRVYGVEIAIAESGTATIAPVFLDEEGTAL